MNSTNSDRRPAARQSAPPPFARLEMMVDGTWLAEGDRKVKKALCQDRGTERKRSRDEKQEKGRRLHAACEDARISRRLTKELGEGERRHRRWGASVRVHGEQKKHSARSKKMAKLASPSRSMRGNFTVVDSQGRTGIYIRGDYVRVGGKGGKPGCAKNGFSYTIRDGAALTDTEGMPIILSNMGKDPAEIASAWIAVEAVARATRKNAKIQYRFVLALDADASEAEKIDAVRRYGEVFEALGLPYSAVIHKPDPAGHERNWHVHLLTSFRPMERVDSNEFAFADDLVTALDGQEGMRTLRHLWAHAQTEAAHRAGRAVEYTGLSHAARGLDLEPQRHLGPALSDLVARGEHVAAYARNQRIVVRNEARVRRRDFEEKREALLAIRAAVLDQQPLRPKRKVPADVAPITSPVVPAPRTLARIAPVVERFNTHPRQRTGAATVPLPPRPRMTRLRALGVRPSPAATAATPRVRGAITTLPAAPTMPHPSHRTGAATTRPVTLPPSAPRSPATLRRIDVPPTVPRPGATLRPVAPQVASVRRGAAMVLDVPARRQSPREPADLFDMPHLTAVPKRPAATITAQPALTPVEPIPTWRPQLEHYLAWLAWRRREDDRARARLSGYAVLPPAYRVAVEAVERDPQLIVEEQARIKVCAGVPRDLAAQIETVAGDPHWREFLRRVRAVALEIEARATRPIPPVLDGGETTSPSTSTSLPLSRDPREYARQHSPGLRPRRS